MGEAFAVKHFVGADAVGSEAALLTSMAHPNVAHCRYCFHDEDKREFFLVMDQLMTKNLASHVKEVNSAKRPVPFPLAIVVDVMLQIACGMEYLHSRKIYHGCGTAMRPSMSRSSGSGNPRRPWPPPTPCIWYAPKLLEQDAAKCTEKADVYSFGMVCFELLTRKIPFEDNHLQGEHMSKNIRAGERPLFPFQVPKYLTCLTKWCWHGDPVKQPAFASVCRILRYVKRSVVMNPAPTEQPDAARPPSVPPVDYLDIEASQQRSPAWQSGSENMAPRVSDVPFQMFAYRVLEKERSRVAILHIGGGGGGRDKASNSSSNSNSLCGNESDNATLSDADAPEVPEVRPRERKGVRWRR
ncbi:unnamed protein product [Miscanthus lutarioriparius]|uniref:Protein kinase domain-containing protein n=1 Tax=Miscanthus lutarioriparius TaxID=422564 RepID=A0A811QMG2_9POAL|nr:unnamed protein product [Miscanthus lutarioriparius]